MQVLRRIAPRRCLAILRRNTHRCALTLRAVQTRMPWKLAPPKRLFTSGLRHRWRSARIAPPRMNPSHHFSAGEYLRSRFFHPTLSTFQFLRTKCTAAAPRKPSTPKRASEVKQKPRTKNYFPMDGNAASSYVAYGMTDNAFIYPISPATPCGEYMDGWAAEKKENIFGDVPDIVMMQSEGGAAGALHGTVSSGALSTTFTASQGLLLMIPNMYLLAGELQPTVFHVAARALARQALSIFCDHSDVMATRASGFALLCSHTVQEAADLALVAHISSLNARLPFMHFYDGLRTSHEIQKIHLPTYEEFKEIAPWDAIDHHRRLGFNPAEPTTRGTGMRPDVYFQASVAANTSYLNAPRIVEESMRAVQSLTGRAYNLFDYYGDPQADRVVVCMGSATGALSETVDYLRKQGEKVGIVKVHLYRPWSPEHFLKALPESAQTICILDRTKEDGALSCPLHLDVGGTFMDRGIMKKMVGGTYGLASKELTPTMAKAVFDNLKQKQPKNHFVIGINDDVTHTSLKIGSEIITIPPKTSQAIFWGRGGDGTVGANKSAIKLISDNTDMFAQGYFVYDSKKQGGVTMSHLRFGHKPIFTSTYEITTANYVAVHNAGYINKLDMLDSLNDGGIFVLNCPWDLEHMDKHFNAKLKQDIAKKKLKFYAIDATKVAFDVGLGARINMVMQSVYFSMFGVMPVDKAIALLNTSIEEAYGRKGQKIVDMNKEAVKQSLSNLHEISYPKGWGSKEDLKKGESHYVLQESPIETREYVQNIMEPMLKLQGDTLPVSSFEPGNQTITGTTKYERRIIATEVPVWIPENCTQCNYCTIVCPHAAIRPFLFDKTEQKSKPSHQATLKTKGVPEISGLNYSIQVAPFGCTGCKLCVAACPDDALIMKPLAPLINDMDSAWEHAVNLPTKDHLMDKFSVKGSQFQKPLIEFSGACSGCGETPYVKLATQLFGDRMIIANASGCSSVWGGTFGEIPYTKDDRGRGPAWGRSLFEDNAEYGLGMKIATKKFRSTLKRNIGTVLADPKKHAISGELQKNLTQIAKAWDDADKCKPLAASIEKHLEKRVTAKNTSRELKDIMNMKTYLIPPSHWIIGGDGWAYDIGFGGLDHVIASGQNVNIMILDTEMYSNTGGQVSKATPKGSFAKYAVAGKPQNKKDLGAMCMLYGNVYVASCSLAANLNQTVQALREAESYDGPSVVLCYATCVDWGHDLGTDAMVQQQRDAVDTGYWPLYRYDPRKKEKDGVPLQMDSQKIRMDMSEFVKRENRFAYLMRTNKGPTEILQQSMADFSENRFNVLHQSSLDQMELLDKLKASVGEQVGEKVLILYASETGNTETLAAALRFEMKARDVRVTATAMDDYDFENLPNEKSVIMLMATCGQGEFPINSKNFWKALQDKKLPKDYLANTKFAMFGMGDSSYVLFNETATLVDNRFEDLGAQRFLPVGMGDDQDADKYETQWEEWKPLLYNHIEASPPPSKLPPPSHMMQVVPKQMAEQKGIEAEEKYLPPLANFVPMSHIKLLTPKDYDRDIRHFEMDLKGLNMSYEMGDSLGIWPQNDKAEVKDFLESYGMFPDDIIQLENITDSRKYPLPASLTAETLFGQILDIFAKPNRRFYEMMATLATDEKEKKKLEFLLTKEGKKELAHLTNDLYITRAGLLQMFPATKPTIPQLLDYVPDIRPRLYSIASSTKMRGDDALHLLIIADDWETKDGVKRFGACTRYLCDLKPGDAVAARVNAAAVEFPSTAKTPMILAGLGTGLAPLRAAIEERAQAKKDGEECGPVALFFGSRHEKEEFPYSDEFKEYEDKGIISIHTAFSRDQEHKIYVPQRINEQSEMIYDYLITRDGKFYYCGTGGSAVDDIQKAVEKSFVKHGNMNAEEASKLIQEMRMNGKYNVEAW